ncbi:hypothetical protein Ga0466249_001513 [Sporomusaceae bacterium BoRhaA]|uniref:hypothetical protein n=1 Tax=Pelorhabdus rhamnosifermentans TaxID=2772457 RepID=UPI001C061BC4|nr:hypothetical protein [Pelorhabdus rhamnosifermentans]MBU2700421.1 hypothetical protein [Pelorhabdus rhamnosifermentans]
MDIVKDESSINGVLTEDIKFMELTILLELTLLQPGRMEFIHEQYKCNNPEFEM